jgi:hypothetical protein
MRGPKGDETQEPAGNTTAWIVVVAGMGRNWADAGSEVSTATNAIAMPGIISPSSAGGTNNRANLSAMRQRFADRKLELHIRASFTLSRYSNEWQIAGSPRLLP